MHFKCLIISHIYTFLRMFLLNLVTLSTTTSLSTIICCSKIEVTFTSHVKSKHGVREGIYMHGGNRHLCTESWASSKWNIVKPLMIIQFYVWYIMCGINNVKLSIVFHSLRPVSHFITKSNSHKFMCFQKKLFGY